MVFPVVMYGCESWTVKKAECRRIDAFELWCWRRLLRVPWTARDPTSPFWRRSAETPVLWPPHAKSWLIGKDSDAGRDWGQEEKGMTEDEMAGWRHWLDGRESEWTPGVGDGQGGLACCDSWGCKESDTTEQLIWSETLNLFLTNYSHFNSNVISRWFFCCCCFQLLWIKLPTAKNPYIISFSLYQSNVSTSLSTLNSLLPKISLKL